MSQAILGKAVDALKRALDEPLLLVEIRVR